MKMNRPTFFLDEYGAGHNYGTTNLGTCTNEICIERTETRINLFWMIVNRTGFWIHRGIDKVKNLGIACTGTAGRTTETRNDPVLLIINDGGAFERININENDCGADFGKSN